MKQVLIKKGMAYIEHVPAPIVGEDSLLVHVYYSCISVGTEMSVVRSSGGSLLKKVLKEPEKVVRAIDNLKNEGLFETIQKVQGKLEKKHSDGI
jgi:hypothetical protein